MLIIRDALNKKVFLLMNFIHIKHEITQSLFFSLSMLQFYEINIPFVGSCNPPPVPEKL